MLKKYLFKKVQSTNNTAIRLIKKKYKDKIGVMSDVALDPYTSHGHDGILKKRNYVRSFSESD